MFHIFLPKEIARCFGKICLFTSFTRNMTLQSAGHKLSLTEQMQGKTVSLALSHSKTWKMCNVSPC